MSSRIRTPEELGARIRDARTAQGLTQAELAADASVSREWLNGIEQGRRPRAELTKVLGVLKALGLSLTLGTTEPNAADDTTTSSRTAELTRQAIRLARPGRALSGTLIPTSTGPATAAAAYLKNVTPKIEPGSSRLWHATGLGMPKIDPALLGSLPMMRPGPQQGAADEDESEE